ncbi:MAG: o-succinylbenzoate synthase, partial [Bacillota bacterium]|nr:o-succinylbenzoate synthase [Bacillota bacterium]
MAKRQARNMKLFSITLHVIKMPLRSPFMTHLGSVAEREGIIVEITDEDGVTGYGEGVAFSTPWYTEETVKTSLHMMSDFLIPLLKHRPVSHPDETLALFASIRGNKMAKAALEMALWDLYAKRKLLPLSRVLGGTQERIPAGVVIATDSISS